MSNSDINFSPMKKLHYKFTFLCLCDSLILFLVSSEWCLPSIPHLPNLLARLIFCLVSLECIFPLHCRRLIEFLLFRFRNTVYFVICRLLEILIFNFVSSEWGFLGCPFSGVAYFLFEFFSNDIVFNFFINFSSDSLLLLPVTGKPKRTSHLIVIRKRFP